MSAPMPDCSTRSRAAVSADPSLAQFFAATSAESTKQSGELQKQLDGYMVTPDERKLFEDSETDDSGDESPEGAADRKSVV